MPQQTRLVTDIEVDEISLVDRPANQHAAVVLAKRATQEDSVADEYFNADGAAVDIAALQPGDVVYDANGGAYEIELEDEPELAGVGKSAFLEPAADQASESIAKALQEELAKALADEDSGKQSQVLSKALEEIGKAEKRIAEAERIAKAER